MNYEEYLEFLLDIRLERAKYKFRPPKCRYFTGDRVGRMIEIIDGYLKTPSKELKPPNWFDIGWLLGEYFGKKAMKMVYGNKIKMCDINEI